MRVQRRRGFFTHPGGWLGAGRRLGVLGALLMLLPAYGQQQGAGYPAARLTTVFPPGAKVGTSVEVMVRGEDLDEPAGLYFSDPSIQAERLPDPPTDPKAKNPVPPPARFRVTIPADAPPGANDVRVIGKWGVSNPRVFVVGGRDEVIEAEPNSDLAQQQKVALGSVVNGAINPAVDVDYFQFAGKKGQRVVAACAATSIDSRLSPFLQLFSPTGRQLASNAYYQDRDAVLDAVLPADGDYVLRVCERTYQTGGPEHFYRLTIGAGPWIDAAYPPVVEAGKAASVSLHGRNLPGGQPDSAASSDGGALEKAVVEVAVPAPAPGGAALRFDGFVNSASGALDGFEYHVKNASGTSNPVLLGVTAGPVLLDNDANDTPAQAQAVAAPVSLCGRVERRNDVDWFAFEAKADDVWVIEGFADRLGAPLDLQLSVRRADNGQVVAQSDDSAEMPAAVGRFFTGTADPRLRFVAPAAGRYQLGVRSHTAGSQFGPRHVYHVRIDREAPDFRLVVVGNNELSGAGCTLRQGGCQDVQVVCFRQDGFNGVVTVTAEGLPPGVTCAPQALGPNLKETALVVQAAADAPAWAGEIQIKGTAVIGGRHVERAARPACLVWPAPQNAPAISRLARSVCLAVRDPGPYRLETPLREMAVLVGGSADFKVQVRRQFPEFKAPVQVTARSAPAQANGQALKLPIVNIADSEGVFKVAIPKGVAPGDYNLVLQGSAKMPLARGRNDKKSTVDVIELAPPVRLSVFDSLAQVSLPNPTLALAAGGEAVLAVKVQRQQNYQGAVTLEVALPAELKGGAAAPVVVPAGANGARLVFKAPPNLKPGAYANVLVRATARLDKTPLTSEAKLTVTVSPAGAPAGDVKLVKLLAEGVAGWKYMAAADAQGDAWKTPNFDDKAWQTGQAPLGAGEEEIARRKGATIANAGQAFLFRHAFDVPAELLKAPGLRAQLAVASDDSASVYINGELVDRDPEVDHEFKYWNRVVDLDWKHLRSGRNVIAVLVTNKAGSSDLYFDLTLTALVPKPSAK